MFLEMKYYGGLVNAYNQSQTDNELYNTRGVLHMEAFTDAQC